jgi:hypothetical protein
LPSWFEYPVSIFVRVKPKRDAAKPQRVARNSRTTALRTIRSGPQRLTRFDEPNPDIVTVSFFEQRSLAPPIDHARLAQQRFPIGRSSRAFGNPGNRLE